MDEHISISDTVLQPLTKHSNKSFIRIKRRKETKDLKNHEFITDIEGYDFIIIYI